MRIFELTYYVSTLINYRKRVQLYVCATRHGMHFDSDKISPAIFRKVMKQNASGCPVGGFSLLYSITDDGSWYPLNLSEERTLIALRTVMYSYTPFFGAPHVNSTRVQ
jgi:hypothetical protein